MGVLSDYFAAPDDATAAACLEDGPQAPLAIVDAKGIEPVVVLAYVETLSGGRSFDEQLADPAAGRLVASSEAGEAMVLGISPLTAGALAGIADADLPGIAAAWAGVEEFGGAADPAVLADALHRLRGLARGADETGDQLYCWVSL